MVQLRHKSVYFAFNRRSWRREKRVCGVYSPHSLNSCQTLNTEFERFPYLTILSKIWHIEIQSLLLLKLISLLPCIMPNPWARISNKYPHHISTPPLLPHFPNSRDTGKTCFYCIFIYTFSRFNYKGISTGEW